MTELVAAAGLQLNPDASHPPFRWHIALPSDPSWSVLDTNPSTWERAAQRLVDDRLAGQRIKTAQRKSVLRFVADLVASCQQAGTVLSLIQIGFLSSGQLSTAGLHVAWYDSDPDPASMATVRQAISAQGVVEHHDTAAGPVLLQRDFQSITPPGSVERVGLTSLQAFLPLEHTTWTAIVATASAHPTLTDLLHTLVLEVAGSIHILDGDSDSFPAGPDDETVYEQVESARAPGIERGFGTLVTHRIEPGGEHSEVRPRPEPRV